MRIYLILCFLLSIPSLANVRSPHFSRGFELDEPLKKDFLELLSYAKDFHKLIEDGDKAAIEKKAKETEQVIRNIQTISVAPLHQRLHSDKLLRSLTENLQILSSNNATRKKRNVKKLFSSFFELAEVYGLKKEMEGKIFYCSRDKSTWVQSGGKPRNPVNPHLKNCGRKLF